MRRDSLTSRLVYLLRFALPALVIAALVWRRQRRKPQPGSLRILVTRLDGIGDFVITSAFLRELRRTYPEAHIMLLVRNNVLQLASACPYVDMVMGVKADPDRKTFTNYSMYLLAWLRHMRELVSFADRNLLGQVDLAIQAQWDFDTQWATLITFLSGAPRRIGYSTNTSPMKSWCNFGHTHLFTDVLPPGPHRHEVERSLDIVRYLGGSIESTVPEIWWTAGDAVEADSFLGDHGLCGQPSIAFGIGAVEVKRRWPFYGELLRLLTQRLDFTPVLLCGPGDEDIIRDIVALCPTAIVVNKLPLRVVASLLSRCGLFVGNDSGPVHLAAASGCPVVEIACHPVGGTEGHANDPQRFGPLGAPRLIIRPKTFAEGCKEACEKTIPHCIATIAPEEVAAAVLPFVESLDVGLSGSGTAAPAECVR